MLTDGKQMVRNAEALDLARRKIRFLAERRGTKSYVELNRIIDAELVREGVDPGTLRPVTTKGVRETKAAPRQ